MTYTYLDGSFEDWLNRLKANDASLNKLKASKGWNYGLHDAWWLTTSAFVATLARASPYTSNASLSSNSYLTIVSAPSPSALPHSRSVRSLSTYSLLHTCNLPSSIFHTYYKLVRTHVLQFNYTSIIIAD
jgi:hypothetical protein